MKKFNFILFLAIFVVFILALPSFSQNNPQDEDDVEYAVGKVQKIISQNQNKLLEGTLGGKQTIQKVKLKVLTGEYKGKIFTVDNQLTSSPIYDIKFKEGARVILDIEKDNKNPDKPDIYISDIERTPALMIIAGIFMTLILVIGGMKGLKTLISILTTAALIFGMLIPGMVAGLPVIPLTLATVLIAVLTAMFIINGINLKSISASIGTLGGLFVSGLIALVIIKLAPLSGFTTQEAIILWTSRPDLNLTHILAASIIIGALGAIMDIGISISSSIDELHRANKDLTPVQLMRSGMNIGNDIIGAMSNTLILAYIGSAMPLIILASNVSLMKFLNLNSIACEITAALAGSIGIVLSVPLTAFVSAFLIGKKPVSCPEMIVKDENCCESHSE